MMWEVDVVAETTDGIHTQKGEMPMTEDEVHDHIAGLMGFEWVHELHIRRSFDDKGAYDAVIPSHVSVGSDFHG